MAMTIAAASDDAEGWAAFYLRAGLWRLAMTIAAASCRAAHRDPAMARAIVDPTALRDAQEG